MSGRTWKQEPEVLRTEMRGGNEAVTARGSSSRGLEEVCCVLTAPTPLEQPVVEPAWPQTPGQGKHSASQGRTGRKRLRL